MLQQISLSHHSSNNSLKSAKTFSKNVSNSISNAQDFKASSKYDVAKNISAYKAYNNIRLASSISFGSSLAEIISNMRGSIVTCAGDEARSDGEKVGELTKVTPAVKEVAPDLKTQYDVVKTTDLLESRYDDKTGEHMITDARIQIENINGYAPRPQIMFSLEKRWERVKDTKPVPGDPEQNIQITIEPQRYDYKTMGFVGTKEPVYILETKGNNVVVAEDGKNVILTDTGRISKLQESEPTLIIDSKKYEKDDTGRIRENKFYSFADKVPDNFNPQKKQGGSEGGGTELIIGLEKGRFVPEIIASIEEFEKKIKNGEIVLDKFVPAKDVNKTKIAMLAGGFGSRAEYANASSSRIMHGEEKGSNLTKGCFKTATGLTPMETSFISLHNAGYLDCSAGNFARGKNIKFWLNDSGKNGGNGSFTVDLYNTMRSESEKEGKTLVVLPNDAMSRIPKALKRLNDMINSGSAAMIMIAKQVPKANAEGKLGIMQIEDDGTGAGLIKAFAEKPNPVKDEFVDNQGNCFANTFQFSVSPEAFKVLNDLEEHIAKFDKKKGKEARDWSKTYTPILMAITQKDNANDIREEIIKSTGIIIPVDALQKAKETIGNQKIYAIKTDEPWADCGTLNALYDTTCKIARGEFPLEDFERKHVLDSINAKTGLVASTPQQKAEIEAKYEINGQIMVVPKADPIDGDEVMKNNKDYITTYSSKFPQS